MNKPADCPFCKIVQGKKDTEKVYEDEFVIGFWNKDPDFPIHILVIPKKHVPTLNDVLQNDPIMDHIGQAVRKIAEQEGISQSGYRLIINVNKAAGQKVFHLHAHVIARENGEDL